MADGAPAGACPVAEVWSLPAAEVVAALGVDPERGLSEAEAAARRARWGPNRLAEARPRPVAAILLAQFRGVFVVLLAVAAGLAFTFGDAAEGVAVVVVLAANAAVGFVSEWKASRSMEALARLGAVVARVRRDGGERLIPAEELVPGDLVRIEEGDLVPADLRLLTASRLEADESALTGESSPVAKAHAPVAAGTTLAERSSMLWRGTAATRGAAVAVVAATGAAAELGKIAGMVAAAESPSGGTPLEARLRILGRRLAGVAVAVAAATVAAGVAAGRDLRLMVETGIALAVAAVPEGLPIVATLALARGMWRLARRHALIRRLGAVETLGSTTLVLTDKTGTLTENRLRVDRLATAGGETALDPRRGWLRDGRPVAPGEVAGLAAALEAAVLCNHAAGPPRDGDDGVGDPLEQALLAAGEAAGIERPALLAALPEVAGEAFDRATQMMATVHREGEAERVAIKGAGEAVLAAAVAVAGPDGPEPLDDAGRRRWREADQRLAAGGQRVLALAEKRGPGAGGDPYHGLTLLGLVALHDPPRRDVPPVVAACRRAGLRLVMATGDQPATAAAIARAVGLTAEGSGEPAVVHGGDLGTASSWSPERRAELRSVPVFARVDPAQKLDLIALHQQAGEVVAMIGDGVNDAPALEKADIGVAMGRRGTQVAREAADLVLVDDALASLVAAVRQGRVLYANLRRFVVYLLSCNLSEILIVGLATTLSAPLPLAPLQILFLNLVTDVFPALALAFGEGEGDVLARAPRDPSEPLLGRREWRRVVGLGMLLTAAVLGALAVAQHGLGLDDRQAVTVSFVTLALGQLWNVFNVRDPGSPLFANEVARNPWVWGALALCAGLLAAAIRIPASAAVLAVADPGVAGWALAVGASLAPWAVAQVWLQRRA